MIVGDSGGFVNAAHREDSHLAMTTGRLAAETAIASKAAGCRGYRANVLSAYKAALDKSRDEGFAQIPRDARNSASQSTVLYNMP